MAIANRVNQRKYRFVGVRQHTASKLACRNSDEYAFHKA